MDHHPKASGRQEGAVPTACSDREILDPVDRSLAVLLDLAAPGAAALIAGSLLGAVVVCRTDQPVTIRGATRECSHTEPE